jgi:hypothetical protein
MPVQTFLLRTSVGVVQGFQFLQPTLEARAAIRWLHVVVEYSVVDFIQFGLLKGGYHVTAFHLANELVLGLGQAFGLTVTPNLVQLLLAGITSAVNACGFAEPINRCFDACGGSDGLNGIS